MKKQYTLTKDNKFVEAICAFSNDFPNHQKPGYLIIGVNSDGSRSGLKVDEEPLQNLMGFRTDGNIVPPPLITTQSFEYQDGFVVVAKVIPNRQPPVRYKGKVCIRIGPRHGFANAA